MKYLSARELDFLFEHLNHEISFTLEQQSENQGDEETLERFKDQLKFLTQLKLKLEELEEEKLGIPDDKVWDRFWELEIQDFADGIDISMTKEQANQIKDSCKDDATINRTIDEVVKFAFDKHTGYTKTVDFGD